MTRPMTALLASMNPWMPPVITGQRARGSLAALGPMQQLLVGQDERHHRFCHRCSPDADAGIMTAPRRNFHRLPVGADSLAGGRDGKGRLEGDPDDRRLARRVADGETAGRIAGETRPVAPGPTGSR